MPGKWKSVLHKKETMGANNKIIQGQTVWIPQNDAAKESNLVDKATQLLDKTGKPYYTPKSPNEQELMKAKNKAKSLAWLKRKNH